MAKRFKVVLWGQTVRVTVSPRIPEWVRKALNYDMGKPGTPAVFVVGPHKVYRIWMRQGHPDIHDHWIHECGHVLGKLIEKGYFEKNEAFGEMFADLFVNTMAEIKRGEGII